jgi:hypothetical protein
MNRRYVDRVRLTATVVDIESESLTVLFPATVAECGDGEHKACGIHSSADYHPYNLLCASVTHSSVPYSIIFVNTQELWTI